MNSIHTNLTSMHILEAIRRTDSSLSVSQSRISTGLKISSATDDPTNWSISTAMKSDSISLSVVNDALGLSVAMMDTAITGMTAANSVVSKIKEKLVAGVEPGVDKTKINKELDELKSQLSSIAKSTAFSGENWLMNATPAPASRKELVSTLRRGADGSVSVGVITFDVGSSILIDLDKANRGILTKGIDVQQNQSGSTATADATYFLLDASSTSSASGAVPAKEIKLDKDTTNEDIFGMISAVDAMLCEMTDVSSKMGVSTQGIRLQNEFASALEGIFDRRIGDLIDADMNETAVILKCLQTQMLLQNQALSIANSDNSTILSLFQ